MNGFALTAEVPGGASSGVARREGAKLDQSRAMDAFLASVERRAFCIARAAVGSHDDALDIVQDAMMRLVRRYGEKPAEQWAPLFYRILRNRITDHQRRSTVKRRLFGWAASTDEDDDPIERVPDPATPGPERQTQSDDARARLEDALAGLPERQRQVFLLRAVQGLDVKETASAMGCSAGSVKTHYFRAVRALRSALEELSP